MPDEAVSDANLRLRALWTGKGPDSQLARATAEVVAKRYSEQVPVWDMLDKLANLLDRQEELRESQRRGGRADANLLTAQVREAQFVNDPEQWAPALQARRIYDRDVTNAELFDLPPGLVIDEDWPDVRDVADGIAYLAAVFHPDDVELRQQLDRLSDHLVAKQRFRDAERHGTRPPHSTIYDAYQRLARHPESPTLRAEVISRLVELHRDPDTPAAVKSELFTQAPRALTGLPLVRPRPGETQASAAQHFNKAATAGVYRARGGYRESPIRYAVRKANRQSYWALMLPKPVRQLPQVQRRLRPLRVLDAGAGTGQVTEALKNLGIPVEVVALDMSHDMLLNLRGNNPEVPAVRASISELPFRDNAFDIVAFGTSLHWGDPEKLPDEVRRVLRDEGAVISINNLHKLDTSYHRLIHGELTSVLDNNAMTSEVVRGGSINLGAGFDTARPKEFSNPIRSDAEGFRNMLRSIAGLAKAETDVQTRAWVGAEVWLREPQNAEQVTVPGRTVVQVARKAKTPASPRRAAKPGRS